MIFGRVQFTLAVCAHIIGKFKELLSDVIFILDLLHNPPLLELDQKGLEPFDGKNIESTEDICQDAARVVGFRAASQINFLLEG